LSATLVIHSELAAFVPRAKSERPKLVLRSDSTLRSAMEDGSQSSINMVSPRFPIIVGRKNTDDEKAKELADGRLRVCGCMLCAVACIP
jgi:hypothetical protein